MPTEAGGSRSSALGGWIDLVMEAASVGRARWPDVRYEVQDFPGHVARVGAGAHELELHGPELVLAAACASGDPAALRVFEAQYIAAIEPSLARFRAQPDFTQEIQQELRCRLLAPPEPRIASYGGTGTLAAWVRVTAVRIGLNLRRTARRRSEDLIIDELLQEIPFHLEHPERLRYAQVLAAAVHAAFGRLTVQQRNLLRLHYADGLGLRELATLERVHRSTIARWLAESRQRIFDLVEIDVRERLGLSPSDFQSIIGLVDSYLRASLSGLLLEPHPAR